MFDDLFSDFGSCEPEPSAAPAKTDRREFNTQLRAVQSAAQDFEWYPTTDEIIRAVVKCVKSLRDTHQYDRGRDCSYTSFLDVGAGNGKVLDAIRSIKDLSWETYAIEKSSVLQQAMDARHYILGCDFWNLSLHDKTPGIIFSNPPYSQYAEWSAKIIREAPHGSHVLLVIPVRWEKDRAIAAEIAGRKAETSILGTWDFTAAEDRTARATVNLVRIDIGTKKPKFRSKSQRTGDDEEEEEITTDPFERFFNETFTCAPEEESVEKDLKNFAERLKETQVVNRMNFIEALVHLYNARMEALRKNYQAILSICPRILREFEISKGGLMESLRQKITTCRKEYWERLFDGMSELTDRLTQSSRRKILERLHTHTGIEFDRDNAYAVVLWAVKNANGYFDSQFIETYEQLVCSANVENYVSNKRVFKWNRFGYLHRSQESKDDESTHFRIKVGHRIVCERQGGLDLNWDRSRVNGLSDRAWNFVQDLLTIARNLHFAPCRSNHTTRNWDCSAARVFYHIPAGGDKPAPLIEIRAFQNGNLHFRFDPDLIHAMNTQHGKLKGWLRDDAAAATELEIPQETAARHFKEAFRLTPSGLALMAPADDAAA